MGTLKGVSAQVITLTPKSSPPRTANGVIYFDSVAGKPKGYIDGTWYTSY